MIGKFSGSTQKCFQPSGLHQCVQVQKNNPYLRVPAQLTEFLNNCDSAPSGNINPKSQKLCQHLLFNRCHSTMTASKQGCLILFRTLPRLLSPCVSGKIKRLGATGLVFNKALFVFNVTYSFKSN